MITWHGRTEPIVAANLQPRSGKKIGCEARNKNKSPYTCALMGVGAYDENIQKIMKDCSMCEYTGQPMTLQLSAPRGGMKNRYMVFLNMSIMPTKLGYPAKEKRTKFNIIKFYICHNCLFRLHVFFFQCIIFFQISTNVLPALPFCELKGDIFNFHFMLRSDGG